MKLTANELKELVKQWENERIEFKEAFSNEVMKDLSTKICSFANSSDGMIIFGVSDEKELVGCKMENAQSNRISQAAKDCSPPVNIEILRVQDEGKIFPVVHIPRSSILHSDSSRKFPMRIGTITAYLDAVGVVAKLRERGLLGQETAKEYSAWKERERETGSIPNLTSVLRALGSDDESFRLVALEDILIRSNDHAVLETSKLAVRIKERLKSGTDNERILILKLLRTVGLWGTEKEKEAVRPWFDSIVDLGKSSPNAELARDALDAVLCSSHPAVNEILLYWVEHAEDALYSKLMPKNMLTLVGSAGLRDKIIEAMYGVYESTKDEKKRMRAHEIIEAARQSYR